MAKRADNYQIIEGSTAYVTTVCEALMDKGWKVNGDLLITNIGDKIMAFQGMVKDERS